MEITEINLSRGTNVLVYDLIFLIAYTTELSLPASAVICPIKAFNLILKPKNLVDFIISKDTLIN